MQRQSPSAAAIPEALQALEPGDAEARVRWLVNFSQQELATLSDYDFVSEQVRMTFIGFEEPWDRRMAFTPEPPRADKKQRRVLRRIQRRVRSCFDALVRNEPLYVDVPRTGHWTIQRISPQ